MTDKERDLGRVISISILLLILLVAMFSSCTPMLYNNNRVMVTHVLALTEMGDTVKIRIQDIQPQRMHHWQSCTFQISCEMLVNIKYCTKNPCRHIWNGW